MLGFKISRVGRSSTQDSSRTPRAAGSCLRIVILTLLGLAPATAWASGGWQESLNNIFGGLNAYWGGVLFWDQHPLKLPLILLVMVGGGIFFTLRYRFVNVRLFKHAFEVIAGKFDSKEHAGEINHFQALTSALSATVGLGNIAGVAVAISLGGPGAVFWLWVSAFLGMSLKFSCCTLAQMYRIVSPDGRVLGGPMVYLKEGFRAQLPRMAGFGKGLSVAFSVLTIGSSFGAGNMFQGNQSYELLALQFPFLAPYPGLVGLVLAFFIGIVIIGGITRIGDVTSKLVPFMCLFYCFSCLALVVFNYTLIPQLFTEIFRQAFKPDAMWAGGLVGVLIQGVKRASFSNEAGLGSSAIAHAAAKTDKPVREGVVAMLEPFIDTHLVCTMTALAILITGAHLEPSLQGKGSAITALAFSSLGSFMPYMLTLATVLFAYSTAISWSYYGEKAAEYLFGRKAIIPYRCVFVGMAALGPVLSLGKVLDFSDIMVLSMAFPNILGMVFLSGGVRRLALEYVQEYQSGVWSEVSSKAPEPVLAKNKSS